MIADGFKLSLTLMVYDLVTVSEKHPDGYSVVGTLITSQWSI